MPKKKDDIFNWDDEVNDELNDLNDDFGEDDEEELSDKKKTPKKVKEQTIEIDGKKYNKDDIASIIQDTKKHSDEQVSSLQQNLLKALGGGQAEEDDDFSEIDFLSNKQYRDAYLKKKFDKVIAEKTKNVNEMLKQQSDNIGTMRYNKVKDKVKTALYSSGVDFDYDKNEKEIEKVIFDTFNEDRIKRDPEGVILYAVEELTKKRGLRNALSKRLDNISVTGAIPVGHKKSTADDFRNRILSASNIGGDDTKDNPFI